MPIGWKLLSLCIHLNFFWRYPLEFRCPRYRILCGAQKHWDQSVHAHDKDVNPAGKGRWLNQYLPSYFHQLFWVFLWNNGGGHLNGRATQRQFFRYMTYCQFSITQGSINWSFCKIPSSTSLSCSRSLQKDSVLSCRTFCNPAHCISLRFHSLCRGLGSWGYWYDF